MTKASRLRKILRIAAAIAAILMLAIVLLMNCLDHHLFEIWTVIVSLTEYPLIIVIAAYYYFHFAFLIDDQEETKSQNLSKDELSAKIKERGKHE